MNKLKLLIPLILGVFLLVISTTNVSALTGNITSLATGRSGASWTGNVNVTFYADVNSIALTDTIGFVNWSIQSHNSTTWKYVGSNNNGSGNQTVFSALFDSAGYSDGRYSLRAEVYNYTSQEEGVMTIKLTTASSTLIANNNTAIIVTLLQNVGANGTLIEEENANKTITMINVTAPEQIIFGSILFDSNNYTMTCSNTDISYCWFDVLNNNVPDQSYDYEITLVGTGANDVVRVNRNMVIDTTSGSILPTIIPAAAVLKDKQTLILVIIIIGAVYLFTRK